MISNDLTSESPLHRAARLGNLNDLERLIIQGVDINSRTNLASNRGSFFRQLTPLMVASGSTDGATVETLRWLVENGANIYAKSAGEVTAAWYAAGNIGWDLHKDNKVFTLDSLLKLKYLLDLGLEPNECSSNGRSLLTEACRVGDPSRVSLLLERGVKTSPRFPSKEKNPYIIPLFCAAQSGSAQCVRLILEKGVDSNTKDDTNRTALAYAGSPEVAQILIDTGVDLNVVDEYGKDAFQRILEDTMHGSERFEIALVLINAGVDINYRDEYGYTRLYHAAFHCSADAVEFLLKCGANPHAKQTNNNSPLHAVCWESDSKDLKNDYEPVVRTIDLLINAGIDVNIKNIKSNTPIHEAVSGDGVNLTAIRTLIRHRAKVDSVTNDGITPLMLAASHAEVECVLTLLAAGADLTKFDNQGLTAVDYLQKYYETLIEKKFKSSLSNSNCNEALEQELQQAKECLKIFQETLRNKPYA